MIIYGCHSLVTAKICRDKSPKYAATNHRTNMPRQITENMPPQTPDHRSQLRRCSFVLISLPRDLRRPILGIAAANLELRRPILLRYYWVYFGSLSTLSITYDIVVIMFVAAIVGAMDSVFAAIVGTIDSVYYDYGIVVTMSVALLLWALAGSLLTLSTPTM